jgi:hypothetical protein
MTEQTNENTGKRKMIATYATLAKKYRVTIVHVVSLLDGLSPIGTLGGQPCYDAQEAETRLIEGLGDGSQWLRIETLGKQAKLTLWELRAACKALGIYVQGIRVKLPAASVAAVLKELHRVGLLPRLGTKTDFSIALDMRESEVEKALRRYARSAVISMRDGTKWYHFDSTLDAITPKEKEAEKGADWVPFDHLLIGSAVSGSELVGIARKVTRRLVGLTHHIAPADFFRLKTEVERITKDKRKSQEKRA